MAKECEKIKVEPRLTILVDGEIYSMKRFPEQNVNLGPRTHLRFSFRKIIDPLIERVEVYSRNHADNEVSYEIDLKIKPIK